MHRQTWTMQSGMILSCLMQMAESQSDAKQTAGLAWDLKAAWQAAWRLWVGLVPDHVLCG